MAATATATRRTRPRSSSRWGPTAPIPDTPPAAPAFLSPFACADGSAPRQRLARLLCGRRRAMRMEMRDVRTAPGAGPRGTARGPEPAAAARSGGPGAAPAAPHTPSGPAKRFCRGMRPGPMLAPPPSSTEWRSGHSPRMIWPLRAALACRSGADRQSQWIRFPRVAATMRPFMRKTCCAMRRRTRPAGRAGGRACRAAWRPAKTGAAGNGSRA